MARAGDPAGDPIRTSPVGHPLPSTRALAADLGWSRGVVVDAYERLVEHGLVVTGGRRGTTVADVGPARPDVGSGSLRPEPVPIADLAPGLPALADFPRAAWLRAARHVLSETDSTRLRYAGPMGDAGLRRELVEWLRVRRGVEASPDRVIVVSGVAQALALIATVLVRRGHRTIGVEDPGSHGARGTMAYWGLSPVPAPVDAQGIDVASLAAGRTRAVMVTPAHQFPVGVVLSTQRRAELLQWAREREAFVVEDDYDADQRYDRRPRPALQALAPERVIHLGSVSKSLAPALRLGWLVAPEALVAELREAKYASDIASPTVPQAVLARLLSSGAYAAHLRRSRVRQRQRRDTLVDLVRRHLPGAQISGIAAGLHVLVTFPGAEFDDAAVARTLAAEGIVVDPLSRHRLTPGSPGFVLGYAAPPLHRLEAAVAALGERVRTATSPSGSALGVDRV